MEKAKCTGLMYVPSDTITKQGKYKDVKGYLNNGYYAKEERNGYWVLVKPARVMVDLESKSNSGSFNMKSDICDFYGKRKISQNLLEKFRKDISDGNIKFKLDENGNSYKIIENK